METIQSILGWCIVINAGLLIWWFLFFTLGHDLMYRVHSRLFKMPVQTFDTFHYAGMAVYKVLIMVFNIAPYVAIRIVT